MSLSHNNYDVIDTFCGVFLHVYFGPYAYHLDHTKRTFPVFFLVTASTTASIVVSRVRTGSVIMTREYEARVETPQHPQPSLRPLATDRPHPASESGTNVFRLLQMLLISHRVNRYREVTLLRGWPTSC